MNLAHGSLYALGAYFGFTLVSLKINYLLALLIAPLLVGLVGLILRKGGHRPGAVPAHRLYPHSDLWVDVLFRRAHKICLGKETRFVELPTFLKQTVSVAGFHYPRFPVGHPADHCDGLIGLMLLLSKTKIGMTMRAASQIPEMVSALGVNMMVVHISAFVLGCLLAGIAGVLSAPLFTIYPIMGHQVLISSFVVIVIGSRYGPADCLSPC